ncbi:HisA/HisF-related TIM barrel protein [Cylindrospermopsis raciborskii]|uniref:HisA/HisF-related TIM barrel protein n=1 Tax=Cylindrospermopsis raciborskii TaxID=77022 RepID=UPI0008DE27A7|nr:HisA/HisF-related TIM barrel protein [Cylindrospermopsis raciborskii]NLQ05932.1 imidazole glycerol phosphate synthase subunit HisF [Cylindrospermopsis raciborskii MVCC19]OHY34540.1 imidazole glycerol phosphate synthase cyclase subunit [Cylindrospermopsis raciborskii MVCC14]
MLKKRIIFTLLYDSGSFMLSRNFRLQRVGNLDWLQRHYNFAHVSFFIDELIVLDVTRKERNLEDFCHTLQALTTGCFVPIAAGGGVRSLDQARSLLRSGADKIVVNSPLFDQPDLVQALASSFGQQCVVGSVDMKRKANGTYQIYTQSGSHPLEQSPQTALQWLSQDWVGELYLNSIDRDGTGQGYDFDLLDQLPVDCSVPVILAGGVGNGQQLAVGFADSRVDAVATAHLFNFVGDGLQRARQTLMDQGANLPVWPTLEQLGLGNAPRQTGA